MDVVWRDLSCDTFPCRDFNSKTQSFSRVVVMDIIVVAIGFIVTMVSTIKRAYIESLTNGNLRQKISHDKRNNRRNNLNSHP